MNTQALEKFAQSSRRRLIEQVSTKLRLITSEGSAARRENPEAIRNLEKQISKHGEQQVIEKNAYIWFNRLCALRFMDANGYTRIAVVSPKQDQTQPEILVEAKSGYFDDSLTPTEAQNQVLSFINRSSPSNNPESEAYHLLLVSACNYYHKAMPYLFARISDFTELLMPDNLLSNGSVMRNALEVMTDESCKEVEIIGWLYQYYISEKKDEVFAGLKKNKKITPENIPAATQLFTPHWIVRYLTENSLGRLWLLNNPESKLIEQMDYYIKPEQNEEDYLRISSPEELKICDPACGSGHMLTYAFDLLYAIYEEEGYNPSEISEKILTHNLFGIEIDERARELSAFALTMKARAKQRNFFQKQIQPNICALKNIHFEEDELPEYTKYIGPDLFTDAFIDTLSQFEETDNFGSLIQPKLKEVHKLLEILKSKDLSGQLFLSATHEKVLQVLKQADFLCQKYHVVIANPPYMGRKGMNQELSAWSIENYPDSKSDLFSMFMERTLELTVKAGFMGMINQHAWMFLGSYEKLRKKILKRNKINTMAHLGARAFESIGGEVVQTTAFILIKSSVTKQDGIYYRLVNYKSSAGKEQEFFNPKNRFKAKQENFGKIPGSPIAYWLREKFAETFEYSEKIEDYLQVTGSHNKTANNEQYVRYFWEIQNKLLFIKWFGYAKGGEFRKWYGNTEYLVDWSDIARNFYNNNSTSNLLNEKYWFKRGITYTDLTTRGFNCRFIDEKSISDMSGPSLYTEDARQRNYLMGLLNSKFSNKVFQLLNPTLHVKINDIKRLPIAFPKSEITKARTETLVQQNINISKEEWDSRETSWDFSSNELIKHKSDRSIEAAYTNYCNYWKEQHSSLHQNEEELNRLFIDIYELEEELTPEVDYKDITLLKNEAKIVDDELVFQTNEVMKHFISYAVGCMFGRYSLDQPGLILANLGDSIDQYLDQIPNPSFRPDDDNVIPLLDDNWFTDDIVDRFNDFVRTTFGNEHFDENIDFIEQSIGKDIRKYFLKDFYSDHITRYKKCPIYWMVSSPNASFNALIYMHRYQADTVSVILNDYLRKYQAKLEDSMSQQQIISISPGSNAQEKTKALREIEEIKKILRELNDFEHEVLYPLANEKIEIDLDDGVKVNYNKFGTALKKVVGLSGR
ncbi:BREX-1 system adenine-specific DNA-methyltransferase PglX [Candidatus Pseudothioglobus singularis]|nr:BREX-1 system adenine-specific DNA-methyltransferase PglX [Candidatus Pseudothioglobus singularis]MDB4821620.1 BREX-1 system adenine-specific DNA-methyltransferase PglX [Candidatus Pseudothioglobus singularis]